LDTYIWNKNQLHVYLSIEGTADALLGLNKPAVFRKLVHRFRDGSGSNIGMPVAEVVVLQVAVDIRRNKLGGRLRLPRYVVKLQVVVNKR